METPEIDRLNAAQWARLREEVDGAMDLPASEAESRLRSRLRDEPLVLSCALSMLAEDEPSAQRMTPLEAGRGDGIEVGPYRTRRQIAVGGMGTVYLAARSDGAIQRLVALKIIRPHLGTTEVLNRFRRERQVQANLDHPGIVRLLDGGATADGQPYLVMEYVEGKPIDVYCDEQRLSIAERLKLFRKVVDAVSHAHQGLVVHRDLKPSNLLVTSRGEPKLLDFGIAKVLDPEKNSAEPEVTGLAMRFLTPAYASPEQMRGSEVTTASDLYSLGVLLYRLLSGRVPYDLKGLSPAEVERLVCEVEPPRASAAVRGPVPAGEPPAETLAANRRTTPADLVRRLSGDLDAIAAMCMRKEARRRYASAASLGEDIDRFLASKPVLARPDSWAYRTGKFVNRNRPSVFLAALSLISLCGGLAFSLEQNAALRRTGKQLVDQRDIAEKRLDRLRSLRKDVVRTARRIHQMVPEALEEVSNLLRTVEYNLSQESELASGDPAVLLEVAEGHIALGRIRYNMRSGNLGLREEATDSYSRALDALDAANQLIPGDARLVLPYREALDLLAGLKRSVRDQAGALACYERLLEVCAAVEERQGDSSNVLGARCLANESSSRIFRSLGRSEEALARAQQACVDWDLSSPENPELAGFREGQQAYFDLALAGALIDCGEFQRAHDTLLLAEPTYQEVMGQHQGLGPSSNRSIFLRKRAEALQGLGSPEAGDLFRLAVASAEHVLTSTPTDHRARALYRSALYQYADHLLRNGQPKKAATLAEGVQDQTSVLQESFPSLMETGYVRQIETDLLLGRLRMAQGDLVTAVEHLAGAQRSHEELARLAPWDWVIGSLEIQTQLLRAKLRYIEGRRSASSARVRARELGLALVAQAQEMLDSASERGVDDYQFRNMTQQTQELAAQFAELE